MDRKQISSITPDSLKSWPERTVAIVAHDAGAARLLFSWLEPLNRQLNICARDLPRPLHRKKAHHEILSDPKLYQGM